MRHGTLFRAAGAALLLVFVARPARAARDGNAPWGEGKPPRGFKMWWRDPSGVVEDLDKFSSLHVRVHGCVWSEYGVDAYDDDGEGRDGDEEWYMGRTLPFRANAAYSLYGILKGHARANKCSSATYINTFVTYMGADTILNTVGRTDITGFSNSSYDDDTWQYDSNSYCDQMSSSYLTDYQRSLVEENLAERGGDRDLSGSGDNNNNYISTTMGCAVDSEKFVMAVFGDGYCDGNYFLNKTEPMKKYNRAMSRVRCSKIWDRHSSKYNGDVLLSTSSACDTSYYGDRCPDPYGRKKRYARLVSGTDHSNMKRFFLVSYRAFAWALFVTGLALLAGAVFIKRRYGRKGRRKKRKDKRKKRKSQSPKSSPKSPDDSLVGEDFESGVQMMHENSGDQMDLEDKR